MTRCTLIAVTLVAIASACGPTQSVAPDRQGQPATTMSAPPRRLIAAIRAAPTVVSNDMNLTGVSGADALHRLISSGLTVANDDGVRIPQLAEAVPSTKNGLWRVFPDGRMETTWRIRPGAQWHDGQPLLASDYAFAVRVRNDRDIPIVRSPRWNFVDAVETPDERTLLVKWKRPVIDADMLFEDAPLPAHLLERVYLDTRETFTQVPYWSEAFVGTGPYRVGEFAAGSHVVLEAFDQYVHGRPRISQIEVRFIPDATTLIANVLADVVQISFGARNLSYEEAAQAREQWRDGAVVPHQRSTVFLYPQFLTPNPAVIGNVQFRRALLHSLDRDELANTFQGGASAVPHGYLSPDVAEYHEIQDAVVRYEYDPRRAAQLVESLGYARDPEGFYRDAANQRPVVQVRTTSVSENQKVMLSVADAWQRFGVATEPHTVPQARAQEDEYRATFPGFEILRQGDGRGVFSAFHTSQARLPENSHRPGPAGDANKGRYLNPELDALMDRYATTIPWQERMAVARDIIRLETDQVVAAGIVYSTDANLVSSQLEHVTRTLWNAHLWNLK